MHNEEFLKNIRTISNLRLRASYGSSGNSQIGDDRWRKVYSVSTSYAPGWGETAKDYYTPGTILANEKIKWETTITRNLGLDFGLYGERINGTLEYYWNTTKDLLVENKIPGFSGYSTILSNVGQTSNRGIEFTLNSHLVKMNDFNLNFNSNIGRNQFKVDKLASGEDMWTLASNWVSLSDLAGWEDYRLEVGKSMGIIYGYVYDGFYTVNDFHHEPGTTNYTLKKRSGRFDAALGYAPPGECKIPEIAPSDEENPLICSREELAEL
ncbi:MAG: TonB-dependent receptor, partial [Rikenellaceae bacterium]|nr:TonB-dependent receptor [Rikenellaceae bacterium]